MSHFATLFAGSLVALAVACGSTVDAPADPAPESSDEALSRARTHCKTVDDCNAAFEKGTWKLSAKTVDTCVQNHDFPYYCMACSTKGVCSFHPGF
jgi:hypothetical protein